MFIYYNYNNKIICFKRLCILDTDPPKYSKQGFLFDRKRYSYTNCLAECKMKSILALCDCIPFFMPVSPDFKFIKQVCTLVDTTCLDKYSGLLSLSIKKLLNLI